MQFEIMKALFPFKTKSNTILLVNSTQSLSREYQYIYKYLLLFQLVVLTYRNTAHLFESCITTTIFFPQKKLKIFICL